MKDIEINIGKKVMDEIKNGNITNPIVEKNDIQKEKNIDVLQKVLSGGVAEFEKKLGREMTYGEMREMFG